jgi:hypothetical protein
MDSNDDSNIIPLGPRILARQMGPATLHHKAGTHTLLVDLRVSASSPAERRRDLIIQAAHFLAVAQKNEASLASAIDEVSTSLGTMRGSVSSACAAFGRHDESCASEARAIRQRLSTDPATPAEAAQVARDVMTRIALHASTLAALHSAPLLDQINDLLDQVQSKVDALITANLLTPPCPRKGPRQHALLRSIEAMLLKNGVSPEEINASDELDPFYSNKRGKNRIDYIKRCHAALLKARRAK